MRLNSLAFRLFAAAAITNLVILPLAGLFLLQNSRKYIENSFDFELLALWRDVATGVRPSTPTYVHGKGRLSLDPTGKLIDLGLDGRSHGGKSSDPKEAGRKPAGGEAEGGDQPPELQDPDDPTLILLRADPSLAFSWYWQIRPAKGQAGPTLTSRSLGDRNIPLPDETKKLKVSSDDLGPDFDYINPIPGKKLEFRVGYVKAFSKGEKMRVMARKIEYTDGDQRASFWVIVSGYSTEIVDDVRTAAKTIALMLGALGLALVAATIIPVRYGLRPIDRMQAGLARIRSGQVARLEGDFPVEITPLQSELNALIQSNQDIIARARTQVGNLAHALKTPLSVVVNEAEADSGPLAEKVKEQARIMRDQIDHYLDRARVAAQVGLVSGVADICPLVQPLVRALRKIHSARGIEISLDCPGDLRFRGEHQDFEEMLGNLIDNACKWANSRVEVTIAAQSELPDLKRILIRIDDDGPGLTAEQRKAAVLRGRRLDETKPGSGLGLSIVADLAELYKGDFRLDQSPLGGLRATLDMPAV